MPFRPVPILEEGHTTSPLLDAILPQMAIKIARMGGGGGGGGSGGHWDMLDL